MVCLSSSGSTPISVFGVAGFAAAYMLDNSCPVSSILNHLYSRGTPLCLNLFNPKYGIKRGVSAVKINLMIFLSFIFSVLENKTALILQGVTSQDPYLRFTQTLPCSLFYACPNVVCYPII